jgi:acyl transferase domain-containing protein/acyl carrier protein
MKNYEPKAVAIVGVGAVLPQAPNAKIFWQNIKEGRYSIVDVPKDRWDPELFYDPDPKVPDKSYSKIGGWVRDWEWDPLKWRMPIPPKVSDAMDLTQKWAIISTREALADYGYPEKPLDEDRTAVILGNAMGGDIHLYTASRILFPEYARELSKASTFSGLPQDLKKSILEEFRDGIGNRWPEINEDTMPGELSNIIAGRIAALYNFHGPNYVADAACASAMAAFSAAIEGLSEKYYDAVITGGIDANMSASTYVKFCKIGALSATGTRPYAEGADGFVMGEGAALFLIKRLADAEREGDKIYAVIRSFGGSSDGKGKGITAPNPIGQKLAVKRAWERSGLSPATASLIEGHGTSTAVGDAVELECLDSIFSGYNLPVGSIALGSVKSNIGHLKGAAGAAGMLKAAFALHEKVLPPSLNFHKPNPKIDFSKSAFSVNTELRPWDLKNGDVRRAGVSAFGFGGTNFHAVMEEYIPGQIQTEKKISFAGVEIPSSGTFQDLVKTPLRGALVIGGDSEEVILKRLQEIESKMAGGWVPPVALPKEKDLRAFMRLAIDYGNASELTAKIEKAQKALQIKDPGMWKALKMRGIFLGKGDPQKLAFLFTGQGSQYVNMLAELKKEESIIANTFNDADIVMTPLLGKPLSKYIFVDEDNKDAVEQANDDLMQTAITQPAVLATDLALSKLFSAYGISPDIVMGHSLGEYGALVVSGAMPFDDALKAVSARGTEMTKVSVEDKGLMAAVFGPLPEIEKIVSQVDGYVVIANINSYSQVVIGGATPAVRKAMKAIQEAGFDARLLSVSHAFHTQIVAPASAPLGRVLIQLKIQPPQIPIVANVTGDFYPMGPEVEPEMVDLLAKQVASPVQFVKGLNTLYNAGARVFVEVGPKKALHGFVEDVLGKYDDITALFSNRPKRGDVLSFNQALCGLYAAGLGIGEREIAAELKTNSQTAAIHSIPESQPMPQVPPTGFSSGNSQGSSQDKYVELGRLFVDFLEKGYKIFSGDQGTLPKGEAWITGASLGLPGVNGMFDDANVERLLNGEQFIYPIPAKLREAMVAKNITRLVKTDQGEPRFETIDKQEEVIKLAARRVNLDIVNDFGFPEDRIQALDVVTAIAIGAGIDALRDAGIPLIMQYKTTTKGTKLPERWILPEEMQDDTGIIFSSAFPGYDSYANEMKKYYLNHSLREKLKELESLRSQILKTDQPNGALLQIDNHIQRIEAELEDKPYHFDRRFLLRVLSMGHSQFAEYIGARGPNTQLNAACASTTQAVGMAKDWIQIGRCRRVIIVSADDVTSDDTLEWFGAGFLATGAAATDELVEDAAIPFDKRRHGMLVGMGGAALVVESPEAAKERGIRPICELLSSITANSAFHGTRLDLNHISQVMEKLISQAETQWGINRYDIAPHTVFVSHETYTPARGGSASAEINALRHVFGPVADKIVIANTKGFTGHAMGVGIEDVLAVKALETSIIPPVANFKEVDPELGRLNLSKGGTYPVRYSLRLGAGFGSQISLTLMRWVPNPDGTHKEPSELGFSYRITDQNVWKNWMRRISGYESPELEIYKRTLRVKDLGPVKIDFKPEHAYSTSPKPIETVEAKAEKIDEKQVPEPIVSETTYRPPSPTTSSETTLTEKTVPAGDPVKEKVMALIEEQTGYPPDMLEMDLDLEADLGIDTVKQAEMFAAIRKEFDIPRDDNLQLRDFPTLEHVLEFVFDNRPDLKMASQEEVRTESKSETAEAAHEVSSPQAKSTTASDPVQEKVLALISEQTGYPTDMLDLELDLEADLGIGSGFGD